jgi:hypothetical protein
MKNVIEGYVGIWIFLVLFYMCMAFTCLNLNVIQARNLMSSIKAQVSASDGAIIPSGEDSYTYDSLADGISIDENGYEFTYTVVRQNPIGLDKAADNSSFIYNYSYKISMKYSYHIPLFGYQTYPLSVIVY